ncbi:MAG: minor capsid protein [Bacillota bacterium]
MEMEQALFRQLDEAETKTLVEYEKWLSGYLASIPWGQLERERKKGKLELGQLDKILPRPDETALVKVFSKHGSEMVVAGKAHGDMLIADIHKKYGKKSLTGYPGFDFDYQQDPRVIPLLAIEAMEKRALVLAGNVSADIAAEVKKIIIGFMVEATREEAESQVAELLRTNRDRGSLIVTTETTYAYNRGRLASFAENRVDYVQFSAVMDARTSPQCRSRHGLVMAMNDPRLSGNTPPLHGRCRSVLVPVYGAYQPELITPERLNWDEVAPLPKGWRTAA